MLGVRLDPKTEKGLTDISRRMRRSKSEIVREVVARYVRTHDEALIAEAKRQSLNAVKRGWSDEDAHWESVAASDDFEAAPPGESE